MENKTYDPKKMSVLMGGQEIKGFKEGDEVTIECDEVKVEKIYRRGLKIFIILPRAKATWEFKSKEKLTSVFNEMKEIKNPVIDWPAFQHDGSFLLSEAK